MTTGIQFTGLASGLDTESIITQLMSIERMPRNRLTLKQATAQAQSDSLNAIRTKLTSLTLATTALSSVTTWVPTQAVDTTDATKVTARRTGGAGPGGYQVEVSSLAASEQRTFTLGDTSAPSTLTLSGVDIAVPAAATIDDVAALINGRSDAPVFAVNVNGSLVLSSRKTGRDFGFTVAGDAPLTAGTVKPGVDAVYSVDGVPKTSPSNVVSDGIAGVELTLRAPTSSPITVNVGMPAPDRSQAIAAVKAFVSAYNDVVTKVRGELGQKRVANPQTTADAKQGDLNGDTMLSSMLDTMRQGIDLSSIGVTTGRATGGPATADSLDGKLTVDDAALSQALDRDPAAVQRTLTSFAQSFTTAVSPYTRAGGMVDTRIDGVGSSLSLLQSEMDDMDRRLGMREDHLRKQFTNLETALSQSQSQSADLASRLASLPG